MEIFNEKSKLYKTISYVLAITGLGFIAVVLLSTYEAIDYKFFRFGLWGWMTCFGGFLVHRGLGDMVYKKKKDGVVFIIIAVVLLVGVIGISATWG